MLDFWLAVITLVCTLSAKDRGATKNPAVDLGTNFDASTSTKMLAQY